MKSIIAALLLLPSVCMAQWAPIKVSSSTDKAVQENFRRAAVYSSRKLDRFAPETIYGSVNISSNVFIVGYSSATKYYGDGSSLTGVATSGQSISTAIVDGSPIGNIIALGTTTVPAGYLYCDGQYVSTTTYSDLFNAVGYKFSTYTVTGALFQLPDSRGMFLRGLDTTGTIDSEARVIGSSETDKFQGHFHGIARQALQNISLRHDGDGTANASTINLYPTVSLNTGISAGVTFISTAAITDSTNGTPRTGNETRPKNVAVAYYIKYAHVGYVSISSTSFLVGSTNTFTASNTFTNSVSMTATGSTGVQVSSLTVGALQVTGAISGAGQAPKIGTFQRAQNAADGTVSITGVGFKPSAVQFIASVSNVVGRSIGWDTGVVHYCSAEATNGNNRFDNGYSIDRLDLSSWDEKAYISSMNSDGFTLTWVKGGTPPAATIDIFYMAHR